MPIGLGTYAYFWRRSDRMPHPMDAFEMLEDTARLGATVFQFCDYPELEHWDAAQLADVRAAADEYGLALELGTRGIRADHIRRYLALADALGVRLIRTMQNTATDSPGPDEFDGELRPLLLELEAQGVTLALETYEQVATATLVAEIDRLGSDRVGICLDVANVVARLETPQSAVALAAPHVKNLHVKDFAFVRSPGLIGFELTGAELGTGLLDTALLLDSVASAGSEVSRIVEHWLPWQGDSDTTGAVEAHWTGTAVDFLRNQ